MTPKFHSLKVAEVRRETADAISLRFEVPAELADDYRFVQGQHLTLKASVGGEELRRSYSICAGVDDGELRVAIKKIGGGVFSSWANESLKAGDAIEVMTPEGRFHTELDPANSRHYVAFAAGSGITPVMSLIKTTLKTEPNSRFTLIYGNRRQNSVIFSEALEDLNRILVVLRLTTLGLGVSVLRRVLGLVVPVPRLVLVFVGHLAWTMLLGGWSLEGESMHASDLEHDLVHVIGPTSCALGTCLHTFEECIGVKGLGFGVASVVVDFDAQDSAPQTHDSHGVFVTVRP